MDASTDGSRTGSPLLDLPGAVAAEGADAGVAAHYGNPFLEQRDLAAGRAVVDLSSRGVLAVTGPDRLSWLDSLTSQRLTGLAPGAGAETLLLDPAGHVEHAMAVLDDGETTWLVVERDAAAPLGTFLDRMRFMLRVAVEDRTADLAVLATLGDIGRLPAAAPAGVPLVWTDPWATGAAGGATAATAPHPGEEWRLRLTLVPRDALPGMAELVRDDGLRVAGVLALEALRIEAWRPRAATEVDDRTLPHELDWLRSAVHLSKGCYRGQETVAKVHNLGRPPRRLVQLDLDGSEALTVHPGDPVLVDDDRSVGVVTSAALHHELGPVALALVKRSLPEDATLVVRTADGGVAAAQRTIVPADVGPAVSVPRLPRLGRAV